MDSSEIKIRRVGGLAKSWLSLEGTVLVYRGRQWVGDWTLLIPVELISIAESKRRDGQILIRALLWLLAPLLGGAVYSLTNPKEGSSLASVLLIMWLGGILTGVCMFIAGLCRFFVRRRILSVVVSREGPVIDFWVEKKNVAQIEELLRQIEQCQEYVAETVGYIAKHCMGASVVRPWRQLAAAAFLFSMPAMFVEKAVLLWLVSIPAGYFVWRWLGEKSEPKEYRQALASYRRQRWDQIEEPLSRLLGRFPGYEPAVMLLAEAYLRTDKFDEAFRTIEELPEERAEQYEDAKQEIWRWKRIRERMREDTERDAENKL